jgi:hypothetical protein
MSSGCAQLTSLPGAFVVLLRLAHLMEATVIERATYGVPGRTADVTAIVAQSVRRTGDVALVVNNTALGGDPAPGADKRLVIAWRHFSDPTVFEREWGEYRSVDIAPPPVFVAAAIYGPPASVAAAAAAAWTPTVTPTALASAARPAVLVTSVLRRLSVAGGRPASASAPLSFRVDNQVLGGDPAVGVTKDLWVVYHVRGSTTPVSKTFRETSTAVLC